MVSGVATPVKHLLVAALWRTDFIGWRTDEVSAPSYLNCAVVARTLATSKALMIFTLAPELDLVAQVEGRSGCWWIEQQARAAAWIWSTQRRLRAGAASGCL